VSVSEHRTVNPSATAVPEMPTGIADPAPLGLAAFAATTFLLSAANAGWMNSASGAVFLGYALAYGGLCQLLAGMWEFRNRNVFGATAFSTYGGFWIGIGLWALLVAPHATALQATHDKGWILLTFAIFNTYMLILSSQVRMAVFGVFLTLEVTEIVGFIGLLGNHATIIKASGIIGVITAVVAWYASAAGVSNGIAGGKLRFPVGPALLR
jgi:succinate-acetate transporter protein